MKQAAQPAGGVPPPCRPLRNEVREAEALADKEKAKKQVPLRLSATLYEELSRWAEDEFRSVNGQIEYLLTEAVRRRKKSKSREEDA